MASRTSAARGARDVDPPTEPGRVGELPAPRSVHLRLLGTFGLTNANGEAVPIVSPRAQSLLAWLALHRDVPQPRRQVSFLLWPDSSEAQAHNNLRQLLHQLRRTWADADGLLSAGGGVLSLRAGPQLAVDLDEYERAVAEAVAADVAPNRDTEPPGARLAFERAADLYRGDFLPAVFDEWILPERARLIAQHERVLDRLIGMLEQRGDYRAAIERANQRLRLDPLDEQVVRWLMRLHALNQDRPGALRVYQACVAVLDEELGVEPDRETHELRERLLEPQTPAPAAWVAAPGSIRGIPALAGGRLPEGLALIGRKSAWAATMAAWDRMTAGEAHLVVIAGEAGIGKTRLAAELCDWAGRRAVASARTRAYAAEGRLSFAPIADWLRSPLLAPALPRLDVGSLSEISRLLPELLIQRPDLPRPSVRIEDWQRQAFFQALARAFLAADQPLLLVLDDLQWCDADTLEWLHFLFRFDRRARILVAGTARPDEIDKAHPLTALVAALRDDGQLTEIFLGPLDAAETSLLAAQVSGRALRPEQAAQIHLETEGNPLFVVETIRAGLIDGGGERGGSTVVAGSNGPRAEGPDGGARRLAPKVQAVIGARLAQLSEPAHDLAALAATVGRAFSLEVIRESGTGDEDRLVAGFDELVRRQIVREQGNDAYDFTHDRIREVAYAEPTEARRRLLHRRVAEALERVHAAGLDTVAAQIAAHFANAGLADRGAAYYQRAAEVAQRIGANLEAIGLIHRGLALLETRPASRERDDRELGLQVALGASMVATEGYGSADVAAVFARARRLCQTLGRPTTSPILRGLAMSSLAQVKIDDCHALGDHMLSLAERDDDPVQRVEAHYVIAMALLLNGRAGPARVELEAALGHYDRARSAEHIGLYSQDPEVVCLIRLALDLWLLGDPVGSAAARAESLRRAEELGHPFSRAYALVWDAKLQTFIGDAALARTQAEAAIELGREYAMPFWLSLATIVRAWAVAEQGDIEAGITGMRAGMAAYTATGQAFITLQLGLLGEQYGRLGDVEQGLAVLAEGLARAERTDERWCEPELHRRRGDQLARIAGRDGEAEAAYLQAIEVARYQGARALELRAASHLGELWLRRDRAGDASRLLEPIVRAFATITDPSLLPDLARARAILTDPDSGATHST